MRRVLFFVTVFIFSSLSLFMPVVVFAQVDPMAPYIDPSTINLPATNNAAATTTSGGSGQCGLNFDPANPQGFPSDVSQIAGLGWARIVYKSSQGTGFYKDIINKLKSQNVKVLIVINQESFYGSGPTSANYASDFGSAAGSIASSLGADTYEIWNEPNIHASTSIFLTPDQLASIAAAATNSIKAASSAQVVIGGFFADSSNLSSYVSALSSVLNTADGISIHPYQNISPDSVASYINSIKGNAKQVWITEFGNGNTSDQQATAAYMKSFYQAFQSVGSGVIPAATWYAYSDGMNPNFGIVDSSGTKKEPLFDSFFKDNCGSSTTSNGKTGTGNAGNAGNKTNSSGGTVDLQCVGADVARYMNAVIAGAGNLQHIKLLSPAFNMSDPASVTVVQAMKANNANFGGVVAIAGNSYNRSGKPIVSWVNDFLAATGLSGKNVFLTETGNFGTNDLGQLGTQLQAIKSDATYIAALLYNVFGTNQVDSFSMTDSQVQSVCGGACGKIGANSANWYGAAPQSFYDRAKSNGMGFTLAIARDDPAQILPWLIAANNAGATPVIRIGQMMDSGDFGTTPQTYIDFLKTIDSQVSFPVYAIAGPNEPETELWASPKCVTQTSGHVYVYPGIEDQKTPDEQMTFASKYVMTCAPQFVTTSQFINDEKIDNPSNDGDTGYFADSLNCMAPGVCEVRDVIGTATIDDQKTTIPLFRLEKPGLTSVNTSDSTRRFDDLEGLFSARNLGNTAGSTDTTMDPNVFLANGNDAKALDQTGQCQNTLAYLQSIKTLCDNEPKNYTMVNGQSAAMNPPQTTTTTTGCVLDLQIPELNESYLQLLSSKPGGFTCSSNTADNPSYSTFMSNLIHVETTTPNAFKPAYIVHYTNYPHNDPPGLMQIVQNWFSPPGASADEKAHNRVFITKIYVPANFASTQNLTNPTGPDTSFPGLNGSAYTSGFMKTMMSTISLGTQQQIQENQTNYTNAILANSKTATTVNEMNPALVTCWECQDPSFIATIVKRINAQITYNQTTGAYNPDCSQTDIVGETATINKQSVNPDGNPDPVVPAKIVEKAILKANSHGMPGTMMPQGPDLTTRTFMLLPEEYRNVTDYGNIIAHTFLNPTYASKVFPDQPDGARTTSKNTDIPGYGKSYKYLQLSDEAFSFDATPVKGPKIGSDRTKSVDQFGHSSYLNTDVNLFGLLKGAGDNPKNVEPVVPGGTLARGLWELVCHVVQPLPPGEQLAYAPYTSFEQLLQKGRSACFVDNKKACTNAPVAPHTLTSTPTTTMSCANFRPGMENHDLWKQAWQSAPNASATGCSSTGSPAGSGVSADINAGVVALAQKVAAITCVPPEVLVGIMAKETEGLKDNMSTPFSGDPTEIYTRNGCDGGNPNQACGPYQYTQGELNAQIAKYGNDIQPCLDALSLTKNAQGVYDTRMLGVSMCVAAANMSRGSVCGSSNATCGGVAPTLSSWGNDAVDNATMTFHANKCGGAAIQASPYSNALSNYRSFIDQFKFFVESIAPGTIDPNTGTANSCACTNPAPPPSTNGGTTSPTGSSCLVLDGTWSAATDTEKTNEQNALSLLNTQYSGLVSKVCGTSNTTVTISYDSSGNGSSGEDGSASGADSIKIYKLGTSDTSGSIIPGVVLTLTHEIGHILAARDPNIYQQYLNSPGVTSERADQQQQFCTYNSPSPHPDNELFAEMVGHYVYDAVSQAAAVPASCPTTADPNGSSTSHTYQQAYPNSWAFARDNVFNGGGSSTSSPSTGTQTANAGVNCGANQTPPTNPGNSPGTGTGTGSGQYNVDNSFFNLGQYDSTLYGMNTFGTDSSCINTVNNALKTLQSHAPTLYDFVTHNIGKIECDFLGGAGAAFYGGSPPLVKMSNNADGLPYTAALMLIHESCHSLQSREPICIDIKSAEMQCYQSEVLAAPMFGSSIPDPDDAAAFLSSLDQARNTVQSIQNGGDGSLGESGTYGGSCNGGAGSGPQT